jgi:hypothetical protein
MEPMLPEATETSPITIEMMDNATLAVQVHFFALKRQ